MPSDVCKQRSCEPKERTMYMYIKLKRNGHEIKNIHFLCVVRGREKGKGTGEVIHLFQTVCVRNGGGEGDWEGDSLI